MARPSLATPVVTARTSSPSLYSPIPAGVMLDAYRVPGTPELGVSNRSPPCPKVPGFSGPANFVQSRSEWQSTQTATCCAR